MSIALDATYSLGDALSGVGVYSREILTGLAAGHPETQFLHCFRWHRFWRSWKTRLPPNCHRRLLQEPLVPRVVLFHGLNQRLPQARLRRAVCTFHDLFVLTGDYSSPEFRRRFEAQARDAAARSDLIVAVSEFTAGQVRDLLNVEAARIRVVRHGVHPFPGTPGPRKPLVLHVGAIQRRKNTVRLVRAFEKLPEPWRLVLAGSVGYGGEETLAAIEGSPARARIRVLGYVSSEELAGLYRKARIFAFPSLDEGFGLPVLEAMAAGVPVLTSNRSALPEVAGDAALLVNPLDEEELARELARLAENRELQRDLGERGKIRASAWGWPAAVAGTWAAYQQLL